MSSIAVYTCLLVMNYMMTELASGERKLFVASGPGTTQISNMQIWVHTCTSLRPGECMTYMHLVMFLKSMLLQINDNHWMHASVHVTLILEVHFFKNVFFLNLQQTLLSSNQKAQWDHLGSAHIVSVC